MPKDHPRTSLCFKEIHETLANVWIIYNQDHLVSHRLIEPDRLAGVCVIVPSDGRNP